MWRVDIFPGGKEDSDEGYVAVELMHMSDEGITVTYSVRDSTGKDK